MPCCDGNDDVSIKRSLYEAGERKMRNLEASFCAVISELKEYDMFEHFIRESSNNAKIPIDTIYGFMKSHFNEDVDRLNSELLKYSNHEIDIIRSILEKKKYLKYLLFAGARFYAQGGSEDLQGEYITIERAIQAHDPSLYWTDAIDDDSWANILNLETLEIEKTYENGIWHDGPYEAGM